MFSVRTSAYIYLSLCHILSSEVKVSKNLKISAKMSELHYKTPLLSLFWVFVTMFVLALPSKIVNSLGFIAEHVFM